MDEIVVIDGEIELENTLDGEIELDFLSDLDPEVVIGTGGAVYPHYEGSYTVTPSTAEQVLDTSDKVMDDDVTVQAVAQGSATTPATIITANPTLSRSGRVVTATVSKTQSVTPTVVEGYVSSGTAGNIGVSGSDTLTIPEGSATTPATSVTANPSISVSSAGVITATVSKSESVTPTVVEGYVSSGTAGTVSVSGSATENLTTQGATTYHVSSSDQTISSGKYLTGAQTIQKVVVSGLTADKIVQGNVVKIGDADDDDRIMSVTGTAQGGITPTGTKQISITQNGTTTEDVTNYASAEITVNVTGGITIADVVERTFPVNTTYNGTASPTNYVFANSTTMQTFSAPNMTNVSSSMFYGCTALTSVDLPNVATNYNGTSYVFQNCTALTTVNMPKVIQLGQSVFRGCTALHTLVLPKVTRTNSDFANGARIESLDLGACTSIQNNSFVNNTGLNLIILRSSTLCSLANANALSGTCFKSGGTGGDIYIPKTLYDALGTGTNDYKSASNWTTYNGYGTITWHAIEGSYYETHYADGTVIA